MELFSEKLNASVLVDVLVKKGLNHVVVSPGSRNAPLTIAFAHKKGVNLKVVIDERSAGFIAMGMAQQLRKPVAVICTSGSAVLNYAPAVAEAYYQHIPLLVLSADRPMEWIDQGDGQTIRQQNVFANFIKKSYHLPSEYLEGKDTFRYLERLGSEIYDESIYPYAGPVHVNIPFDEPLYNTVKTIPETKLVQTLIEERHLSEESLEQLVNTWRQCSKIMILCGVMEPSVEIQTMLETLAGEGVVVLSESTSNLYSNKFITTIDSWLVTIRNEELDAFAPQLLVTIGGSIVSKRIKSYLRKHRPQMHWHVAPSDFYLDTFQSLSVNIPVKALPFFKQLLPEIKNNANKDYFNKLVKRKNECREGHGIFLENAPFSDIKVFEAVLKHLPAGSQLQLGNSTPVRYAQLFEHVKNIVQYSNRGTSGIDGSVSTAVGAALTTSEWVTLIVGDISFLYDSNALWNKHVPENLRIIIVNNDGGNIFRIIDGPSSTGLLEDYFEVNHGISARYIAKTYGVNYAGVNTENELYEQLSGFYNKNAEGKVRILEVFTSNKKNPLVLKDYFKFLKEYKTE